MIELLKKLAGIDRRFIYAAVFLATAIPILTKATMKVEPLPEVRKAYEYIESLPESSVVMVSIDYDAASMPELQPMLEAFLHHSFSKNLRVIMLGHWPLGLPLGQQALEKVAGQYNKEYGVDYVFLGYRPGVAAVIINLGKDFRTVFSSDYAYTPIDSLPLMREVSNYKNVKLLLGLEAGAVGDAWVQYGYARYNLPIILGSTAVSTPDYYPYMQANQVISVIGGLRGAADYETLLGITGEASIGMLPQSVIHLVIIAFIIIGNIGFLVLRRAKK
ncbi:MAG TPA: hypothetical protein PKU94_05455 [Candidatus Hydrothermia bacterium]|nr:hypothetical protein [Candidatus Hydrothermae bacterium]MDD3649590.1 hypothetical protein [Candidatus Hydrothermia bacterium]HOK23502.1 hypothetical protein [Candidatus Hydrothermia bacterium]HOL24044.1 hypothetical protein [Candidatus Hydrothermia bacterium]HOP32805.1 hypothetical protein [Candidatus Hydrothermia bacterium]